MIQTQLKLRNEGSLEEELEKIDRNRWRDGDIQLHIIKITLLSLEEGKMN